MKKLLSLVLILAMVLACVSAFAEEKVPSREKPEVKFEVLELIYGNQNGIGNDNIGGTGTQNGIDNDYLGGSGTQNGINNDYYGGSNTYTGGSNTSIGGSGSQNGIGNDYYGGSNTYMGGSNTYMGYGSHNQNTSTTLSVEVEDVLNNKSRNQTTTFSNIGNNSSTNTAVSIVGSGNTDSSDHSTKFFYINSFNDNSDYSTNGSHNKTAENSGNSSSSSSSSAAAGGSGSGSGSKGSGSGSGSGSTSGKTSGGSSSSGSKGASSSASSKAIVISGSNGGGSGSGSGSSVKAPSIQLVQVPDTAETTALKNAFAEAIKAGDPKTALPENVASKLSADLKTINEFVTAKLVGDISGLASATVNVAFPTKYAAGDKVVVLFGIPNGASTQWINVNGIIESDGSISMILTSTVLEALAGKTFALAVLSK